eukprot:TRINITY_DN21500_c0_g1_i1.p1 TRINITY_DN21500_c0_g1~~TRINITY_DN21500_c0_g1_i1.p1  ORF type:complete len:431 (+),score=108.61 TRINITY_DN21500_c0_g1_i1:65-1357(+)
MQRAPSVGPPGARAAPPGRPPQHAHRCRALAAVAAGLAAAAVACAAASLPAPDCLPRTAALRFWWWTAVHVSGLDFGGRFARDWASEAVRAGLDGGGCPPGRTRPVPEMDAADLDVEAFRSDYLYGHRPVVIRGLLSRYGMENLTRDWSLEMLAARFADVRMLVKRRFWTLHSLEPMSFGRYAELIRAGGNSSYLAPSNEFFHADGSMETEMQGLTEAIYALRDTPGDSLTTRLMTSQDKPYYFFISAGGDGELRTSTPVHCDATTTFLTQLQGRKSFTLMGPEASPLMYLRGDPLNLAYYCGDWGRERDEGCWNLTATAEAAAAGRGPFRAVGYTDRWTTVLGPGDMIFWPAWWWHYVENVDPVSVGVSIPAVSDAASVLRRSPVLAAAFLFNPRFYWNVVAGAIAGKAGTFRAAYFSDFLKEKADRGS